LPFGMSTFLSISYATLAIVASICLPARYPRQSNVPQAASAMMAAAAATGYVQMGIFIGMARFGKRLAVRLQLRAQRFERGIQFLLFARPSEQRRERRRQRSLAARLRFDDVVELRRMSRGYEHPMSAGTARQ